MNFIFSFLCRLLFVLFTDRQQFVPPTDFQDAENIKPFPMVRNLANVWAKYPQYNEENTIMISNYYNEVEDFQRNDLIIPEFDPKLGKTDFLDDMHLNNTFHYLQFI